MVRPGLYRVQENSRVKDILPIAGGIMPHGDLNQMNLAAIVKDGKRYHVKDIKQTRVKKSKKKNKHDTVSLHVSYPININYATQKDLIQIPGIGKSIAHSILELRGRKGHFQHLQELQEAKGVGASLLRKIEVYITL